MASILFRLTDNIKGPFYIDNTCIACNACIIEAPVFFKMDDIKGHALVIKQPDNAQDEKLCLNALESCPVDAIGSNG